jgi:hypothetical protein
VQTPQPVDTAALLRLLALRYRLQWAKVRSRDGRIALLVAATLVVVVVAVLMALGGIGTAVAAVRAGKADRVALGVLTTFYVLAISVSIFMGIGVNAAFSNATLRRYPLSARDRFAARHLTAILDPLWFVCLALYLGVAIGFSILRVAPAWLTVPAAVLLLLTNFSVARAFVGCAEWILGTRVAPFLLVALAIFAMTTPPLLREPAAVHLLSAVARLTPPGIAARIMAGGSPAPSLAWVVALMAWAISLALVLAGLDRLPARSRTVPGARAVWDGPCDRFGALFGATLGPLVTKMLRYYTRSPQVRWNFPFVLPMLVVGCVELARGGEPMDFFLYALGALAAVGFMCTGAMSLNLFGFDGAGFRRYFLLPAPPSRVVRAATVVAILPGAMLVTLALAAWALFRPVATDARILIMLAASGFGGLLFSQALSIWIAVLWPRPAQFAVTFGNRLSAAGGAALCGGVAALFGLPLALHGIGAAAVLRAWIVWPVFGLASCVWYVLTQGLAARAFGARREEMLAIIEGQQGASGGWLVR